MRKKYSNLSKRQPLSSTGKAIRVVVAIVFIVALPLLVILTSTLWWVWDVIILSLIYYLSYALFFRRDWINEARTAIHGQQQPSHRPQQTAKGLPSGEKTQEIVIGRVVGDDVDDSFGLGEDGYGSLGDGDDDLSDFEHLLGDYENGADRDLYDEPQTNQDPLEDDENDASFNERMMRLLEKIVESNEQIVERLDVIVADIRPPETEFEIDPTITPTYESLPSFIKKRLSSGQTVVVLTKLHWVRKLPAWLLLFGVTFGYWWAYSSLVTNVAGSLLLGVAIFAAVIAYPVIALLKLYHRMIAWTNEGIFHYRGIITIYRDYISYSKITDFTSEEPLAGRILGYFTVVVETPGQKQAINRVAFLSAGARKVNYLNSFVTSMTRGNQRGD